MKQLLTTTVFLFVFSFISKSQEVITTSGDFYANSTAELSWTLGEVMTESYLGTANHLTQGEQQTMYDPVLSVEKNEISKFQIYPNPTNSSLTFISDGSPLQMKIKDSRGALVATHNVESSSSKIDMTNLERGVYYIHIYNDQNQFIENLKVVKL